MSKLYYVIRDDETQEARCVVSDYGELNQLITGMFSDFEDRGYYYDIINRKEARKIERELSERLKEKAT